MRIKISPLRRAVQIFSFSLLVYIIWKTAFPLNNFLNPSFYFYIDPFAMFITAIAERVLIPGLVFAAGMIVLSFILGRFFCGWICPLGAAIDFSGYLLRGVSRIFAGLKDAGASFFARLRYLKYGILFLITVLAIAGVQTAWIIDPITIFVRAFSLNIHPQVNSMIESLFGIIRPDSEFGVSIYMFFQQHILNPQMTVFTHSRIFLYLFAAILILTFIRSRFWCRYVCPLGALLALPAGRSLLERETGACPEGCGLCVKVCRMNAIRDDNSYMKDECVLCMDCRDRCPAGSSKFTFNRAAGSVKRVLSGENQQPVNLCSEFDDAEVPAVNQLSPACGRRGISRLNFIKGVSVLAAAVPAGLNAADGTEAEKRFLLRPPGSLPENEFIQRCIRCGNCMKVCPTGVIMPASLRYGFGSLWSPRLDPESGYCEYLCNLCGKVCPTGAIEKLSMEEKTGFKIGLAVINRETCFPWAEHEECIVCEEHCPVPDKAIKVEMVMKEGREIKYPHVVDKLCIGCAICEHVCPVLPVRGIRVFPER